MKMKSGHKNKIKNLQKKLISERQVNEKLLARILELEESLLDNIYKSNDTIKTLNDELKKLRGIELRHEDGQVTYGIDTVKFFHKLARIQLDRVLLEIQKIKELQQEMVRLSDRYRATGDVGEYGMRLAARMLLKALDEEEEIN